MQIRRTSWLKRSAVIVVTVGIAISLSSCGASQGRATAAPTKVATKAVTEQPVRAVDEASGEQSAPIHVDVDGGKAGVGVTFRKITLAPGATTGVHCHYGQLIAVVEKGELTHYADIYPSGVHVYKQGDSLVEGRGYRHEGRNEGKTDTVLWVTYVIPEGKPLAETNLKNCDR